jgi:hypothetical protein
MKSLILLISCVVTLTSFAQKDSLLFFREQELELMLTDLRNAKSDLEKEEKNQVFKTYLKETLLSENVFSYPFSRLKTLGSITSPDLTFRFFNWNIEQEDQSQKYYCFILKKDERKNEYTIIELIDNSFMLPPRPDEVLNEEQWYGALYYKIIPVSKAGKTYYTLLGWDGSNAMSSVKLIDVLSFSGKHVKFGNGIFKTKEGTQKRVFFEYSKKAVMSLAYDEQRNRIIFDHLSPESPGMEGFYEYYVPDMSYDAFVFTDNKWVFQEDVVGLNGTGNRKINIQTLDPKSGDVVSREVKNTWEDPSNENAPAGGNIHTPALPDNETLSEQKKKDKKTNEIAVRKEKRTKRKKEEFSIIPSVATDKKGRKK